LRVLFLLLGLWLWTRVGWTRVGCCSYEVRLDWCSWRRV